MINALDISQLVIDGIPILLGMLFLLGNRRAKHRLRNARYAQMMFIELKMIAGVLGRVGRQDKHGTYWKKLPSNAYDGLVSSTNISYFDTQTQKALYYFYDNLKHHNQKLETSIIQSNIFTQANNRTRMNTIKLQLYDIATCISFCT